MVDIRETYGRAVDALAMPPFPSDQLNDHRYSTTPSVHGLATQVNYYHQFLVDANAYQLNSRIMSPSPNEYHKPRDGCWRLRRSKKTAGKYHTRIPSQI